MDRTKGISLCPQCSKEPSLKTFFAGQFILQCQTCPYPYSVLGNSEDQVVANWNRLVAIGR